MKDNLSQEYGDLIKDTVEFLQKMLGRQKVSFKTNNLSKESAKEPSPIPSLPVKVEKERKPEPPPSIAQPRHVDKVPESKEVIPGWELQPMPMHSIELGFKSKLAKFIPVQEPFVGAFMVLPEEDPSARLFLENVARAITRSFTSACVVLYDPELLQKTLKAKLLIPCNLLKKKFPKAQPHQKFIIENCEIIPLENLDLYATDLTAKRSLWQTIQLSFQS